MDDVSSAPGPEESALFPEISPSHDPELIAGEWLEVTVPPEWEPGRVDRLLAKLIPDVSRNEIQRWIQGERLLRQGQPLTRNTTVSPGDVLHYLPPPVEQSELRPIPMDLAVLFEDEHILIIDKPAGVVVHPGAGNTGPTLVQGLLHHCGSSLSGIGGVARPGIVHRLDKETSGVMVVAKHDAAHRVLASAFSERSLAKYYRAFVKGVPRLRSGREEGAIERHPVHRHRMRIAQRPGEGRPARTDWEIVEAWAGRASDLLCRIHSGRTHQIRVHLSHIGHPILGDRTYGWNVSHAWPWIPPRILLHAFRLVFTHPVSGDQLDVSAPLPTDYDETKMHLGKHS